MRSPPATMPRSPCEALTASSTTLGAPVLESVAAIFAPIWPDLPMPVTINFAPGLDGLAHGLDREAEGVVEPTLHGPERFGLDLHDAAALGQMGAYLRRLPGKMHPQGVAKVARESKTVASGAVIEKSPCGGLSKTESRRYT